MHELKLNTMKPTTLNIEEIKETLTPYQERFNIRFIDSDLMQINDSFHFLTDKIHSITEDDISITIRAEGYAIHLFKRFNNIHASIF